VSAKADTIGATIKSVKRDAPIYGEYSDI